MKMPETIPDYFLAPCGVNCFVCYAHLKNKKPCSGCLGDDNNKPERCKNCDIKKCAAEKGYTHCYECSTYPCTIIKRLEKSYLQRYRVDLRKNCEIANTQGPSALMKDERIKWICPKCNGVINQHDKICSECNTNSAQYGDIQPRSQSPDMVHTCVHLIFPAGDL